MRSSYFAPKEIKKSRKWGCWISVCGSRVENTFFSASDLLFFVELQLQKCLVVWLKTLIYIPFSAQSQWADDQRLCKANRKIVHLSRKSETEVIDQSRSSCFTCTVSPACVCLRVHNRHRQTARVYQQSSCSEWKLQRRLKYSMTSVPIYEA